MIGILSLLMVFVLAFFTFVGYFPYDLGCTMILLLIACFSLWLLARNSDKKDKK